MSDVTNAIRIIGISGSLREASFNTALLKILKERAAPEILIDVVTLDHIPFYNQDLDKDPQIPTVAEFRNRIATSDDVLNLSWAPYIYSVKKFDFDGRPWNRGWRIHTHRVGC